MRACVHACMRACAHAYMRACGHACMHACVHAYLREGEHAGMRACMHAGMRSCGHAGMRACVDAFIRACVHACMRTLVFFAIGMGSILHANTNQRRFHSEEAETLTAFSAHATSGYTTFLVLEILSEMKIALYDDDDSL